MGCPSIHREISSGVGELDRSSCWPERVIGSRKTSCPGGAPVGVEFEAEARALLRLPVGVLVLLVVMARVGGGGIGLRAAWILADVEAIADTERFRAGEVLGARLGAPGGSWNGEKVTWAGNSTGKFWVPDARGEGCSCSSAGS